MLDEDIFMLRIPEAHPWSGYDVVRQRRLTSHYRENRGLRYLSTSVLWVPNRAFGRIALSLKLRMPLQNVDLLCEKLSTSRSQVIISVGENRSSRPGLDFPTALDAPASFLPSSH